ncbi:MAG: hypothetical protein Q9190_003080 [Brigantiaea leucoxantha]
MAGNLGARPLGPILIKRFERLFDGPPKVLKSHGKEGTTVGWLDVVEFARNKPEQFNLEKMRDGVRVCQFYTKQSRVEISEEDYQLIASGMPQKLIPPQPIVEDEEKELGTLEILEKNLGMVVQLADQVSARARQLNHRLKNRKNAIISRREAEAASNEEPTSQSPRSANFRGSNNGFNANEGQRSSVSPTGGFVAVNHAVSAQDLRSSHGYYSEVEHSVPKTNGSYTHGASPAIRAELLSKFFTNSERNTLTDQDQRSGLNASRHSGTPKSKARPDDYSNAAVNSTSPVPIPNTPSSLLPYPKPSQIDRHDDSGPYKGEMMARMEQLTRGDRVQPPCDRCRRLHMDCLKNLTACMGCTKKHAKCSWKDVTELELLENPIVIRSAREERNDSGSTGERERERSRDPYKDLPTISSTNTPRRDYQREEQRGVRDEELLGEDASADEEDFPRERELSAHAYPSALEKNPSSPDAAPPATVTAASVIAQGVQRMVGEQVLPSAALASSPKKEDPTVLPSTNTIATREEEQEYDNQLQPTNGFQSVNIKGVLVDYDTEQRRDEREQQQGFYEWRREQERERERERERGEDERKGTEEKERERDALVQLSAAAREVGDREREKEREKQRKEGEGERAEW